MADLGSEVTRGVPGRPSTEGRPGLSEVGGTPSGQPAGRRRYIPPPPTKWTISSWSPSARWVSAHWSRGTMLRFNSTATRSCFMPSCSTSSARVMAEKSCFWPLMVSFISGRFSQGIDGGSKYGTQAWPVATLLLFLAGICGWRCGRNRWLAPGRRNLAERTRPFRFSFPRHRLDR